MGVLDETTRFQVMHKRWYVHAKISSVVKGITVEKHVLLICIGQFCCLVILYIIVAFVAFHRSYCGDLGEFIFIGFLCLKISWDIILPRKADIKKVVHKQAGKNVQAKK